MGMSPGSYVRSWENIEVPPLGSIVLGGGSFVASTETVTLNVGPSPVPLPATLGNFLGGIGLGGVVLRRRRA